MTSLLRKFLPTPTVPGGGDQPAPLRISVKNRRDGSHRNLGGRLLVRHGKPRDVIAAETATSDSSAVYWNRDVSPFSRTRDEEVEASLAVPSHTWYGSLVHPPGSLLTQSGAPYKVFTPFYRQWLQAEWEPWPESGTADIAADPGDAADHSDQGDGPDPAVARARPPEHDGPVVFVATPVAFGAVTMAYHRLAEPGHGYID